MSFSVLFAPPVRKSRYLRLDGSAGAYLSAPDSAATSITGDIDIRVKCALDDWTPAATSMMAAKGSGVQLSWTLWVDPAGTLTLQYSQDGTVPVSRVSTVATGIADGTTKSVRCTVDVANSINHDVRFYLTDAHGNARSPFLQRHPGLRFGRDDAPVGTLVTMASAPAQNLLRKR